MGNNHPLYIWQDVTQTFLQASQELKLGELLHDDVFRLFEAMSAIEIMDPKMDSGINTNMTPLTFDTAAKCGHLPLADITPEQFIGIMDESLTALVVWLEGHSLVQTVFTNLYTHKPDLIRDEPMQCFTTAYLRIVEVVRKIILEAGVSEEEDHQPTLYGFKMPGNVTYTHTDQNMHKHELSISQKLKSIEESFPENGEHKELNKAVNLRLTFVRYFLNGLLSIDKGEMLEGMRGLGQAKDLIESVIATVNTGVKPEAGKHMLGFDPATNQRLLPPTFPRYTQMKDRAESYQYIKTMITQIMGIADINHVQGFSGALSFYETFSASGPVLLSRSVMHLFYTPLPSSAMFPYSNTAGAGGASNAARKSGNLQDLLQESCREFHLPPAILESTKMSSSATAGNVNIQQVRQCLDMFFFQCCRPFGFLLQSYGHNRARQREKLAAVLEEFFTPQEEADKIDKMLNSLTLHVEGDSGGSEQQQSLYLSSWLIYHVIKIMIKYILSGFELELFAVHEYTYIFFYLHDLLYPWLINCLHRADISRKEIVPKKKEKNKAKLKNAAKNQSKHQQFALEMAVNQAKSMLCGGLLKFMIAAKKEKKIQIPSARFDNEEVRYRHRFDAFSGLFTPPMAPYEHYKEVVNLTEEIAAKDLYLLASKDFSQSRHILESLIQNIDVEPELRQEVADLITLLKTNFVVSSILGKDAGTRAIHFDFALHPHFPLLKLV
eukprot:TRINITY_DN4761_c0_g1_i1.p1 TRINITY_DN4761_c0_g1~~TRINITY_DN4761_c0_g1_i1.p1  ORF type:complete len:760 (+),score=180.75 TRINITY_DN4761_c0_g1_i1:119-2281(+)